MNRPPLSWEKLNRQAPYAIAFVLPLGFLGVAGVVLAPLYALVNFRSFLRLSWRPILVALPFALITVAAAIRSGAGSSQLASAIGMALLLTVGFQSMRLLAKQSIPDRLIAAFLAGSMVLGASVVLDFALGWNRLPSGLFLDSSLHNWAGTLFALSFPLALYIAGHSNLHTRVFGIISALGLATGTVMALTWVGMLGLLAGALVFGILQGRKYALSGLAACVLGAASYGPWKNAGDGQLYELQVRGHALAEWEYVIEERLVIFREGIRLGLVKPWLGWGFAANHGSLAEVKGLVEARAELTDTNARGMNLLRASEAIGSYPWRGFYVRDIASSGSAPDGTKTADLLVGMGVEGQRVQQLAKTGRDNSVVYNLSIWARTEHGENVLALSMREPDGSLENVASLSTELEAEVVGTGAVRFHLDEEWQRLWLNAEFHRTPETGVLAVVALDGYHTEPSPADRFYVWGAQLNKGAGPSAYSATGISAGRGALERLPHFHNWFVQALFETGLVGLVALIGFLTWLFARAGGPLCAPLRAALLAFVATQLFDYAALQSSIFLCALLVGALGLQTARAQPQSNHG